jgi:hypothetical protein
MRGLLVLIIASINPPFLNALFLVIGIHFLTFDFGLNISRWKKLKNILISIDLFPRHRKITSAMVEDIRKGNPLLLIGELEIELRRYYRAYLNNYFTELNKKELFIYKFRIFTRKLFYHGDYDNMSFKNFHHWYDLIWSRIPPQMELLIKGIVFGTALYFWL